MTIDELALKITDALVQGKFVKAYKDDALEFNHVHLLIHNALHVECDLDHLDVCRVEKDHPKHNDSVRD